MSTTNAPDDSPDAEKIECPLCENGIRRTTSVVNDGVPTARAETRTVERECELCNATGTVPAGHL